MNGDGKVRVLLVDDRPANLVALEATLASPEYEIVKAASGAAALRYLLDHECAIILLDVQMPGMDGFETAEIIKADPRRKDTPIIFITAINHEEMHVLRGYKMGAIDYVSKPIVPAILRSKVANFAALHRSQQLVLRQAELLRAREADDHRRAVTELERAQAAREQALHRRYHELVDGITHAIVWAADPTTLQLSFVSPSASSILGCDRDALLQRPAILREVLHPDDDAALLSALGAATTDRPTALDHRLLRADGGVVWLSTVLRLEKGLESEALELRGLSVDVTALHEAIAQRDDFLSIASHELKTPLSPLMMQIQLIARAAGKLGTPAADGLRQKVEMAERQVERLAVLVETLTDVTRIRAGKLAIQVSAVDAAEVVADVIARAQPELTRKEATLTFLGRAPVIGRWDRVRLDQVVTNLVSNAIKYGEGRPIEVALSAAAGRARLVVTDHGIGIAPQNQARVFARFERAVTDQHYAGMGLGLYIVHEIVKAHGGEITVESVLGQGSRFTVELPTEPGLHLVAREGA